jgi:hypothetical protein
MQSPKAMWIVGGVFFLLPTIAVILGKAYFYQQLSTAFKVSMILAAIIPPALVLSSSVKWRIAFALGLWLLLGVQFCLILVALLAGFRE